eukprot:199229_1
MGSDNSKETSSGSTRYTHTSWYNSNDTCYVHVCSRSLKDMGPLTLLNSSGVHHYIVVNVVRKKKSDHKKWIVHEWLSSKEKTVDGVSTYRRSYACESLRGYKCMTLGNFKLFKVSDVYEAVKKFDSKTYGNNFNCNIWTEHVVKELGYKIKVHWNCSCVAFWNQEKMYKANDDDDDDDDDDSESEDEEEYCKNCNHYHQPTGWCP